MLNYSRTGIHVKVNPLEALLDASGLQGNTYDGTIVIVSLEYYLECIDEMLALKDAQYRQLVHDTMLDPDCYTYATDARVLTIDPYVL